MNIYNQTLSKLITSLLVLCFISCKPTIQSESSPQNMAIEKYVKHIIQRHQIPGVALAIIKNDRILFKKNFGKANLEHGVPIKDSSIFRVYSLTKLPVAVAIFQLIEKKQLSLNDSISKYVDNLPISWKAVQVQHLLTHSSGLPKMRSFPNLEKLTEAEVKQLIFKKKIQFKTGEKYDYNQTNFWLLQQIIERVSGDSLSDFILKKQFDNEQQNVFFSSNSKEIIKNRVTAYFPFETGTIQIDHPTLKGNYMFAANGLNITLQEFMKWNNRLKNHKLLKPATLKKMWQTFNYTKSNKVFTNGWDKRTINNHDSYGFSGSLVTAYRIFPEKDISIIFLANGLGNYFNIENIVNHIASLVDEEIVDIHNLAFEILSQAIVSENIKSFDTNFEILKSKPEFKEVNLENLVNAIGYQLINQKRIKKAIEIFKFNTQKFPTSANTFDSLGEIYYRNYNDSLAIVNYKKAIALGGTNGNAKRMLKQLSEKNFD